MIGEAGNRALAISSTLETVENGFGACGTIERKNCTQVRRAAVDRRPEQVAASIDQPTGRKSSIRCLAEVMENGLGTRFLR
ncbi:MAG: hypothetical protein WDN04_10390 [Rhodospirillales bacterium]